MPEPIPDDFPLHYRLALSYAPARSRGDILTLLLFDLRLAAILRKSSQPLIAQLKLAWWRDRLRETPENWPMGEPLLERLRDWRGSTSKLVSMVDAWEMLLGEDLSRTDLVEYASGRAAGWVALDHRHAIDPEMVRSYAVTWALVDLSLNLSDADEAEAARELARESAQHRSRLDRALRSLTVLAGLARRNLDRGSDRWLDGPGAIAVAIRLGLTGR